MKTSKQQPKINGRLNKVVGATSSEGCLVLRTVRAQCIDRSGRSVAGNHTVEPSETDK